MTDTRTPITYPNRDHKIEDTAARRRALARLDLIQAEVEMLRKRIGSELADGDDGQTINRLAGELTTQLTIIGTLRGVREWDAAGGAS